MATTASSAQVRVAKSNSTTHGFRQVIRSQLKLKPIHEGTSSPLQIKHQPGAAQNQITKNVLLGAEIYYRTTMETGGRDDTAFNIGTVIDFTEHQHLLFSAGGSLDGRTEFQCYIAYQFTFDPEIFHSIGNWFGHR